MEVWYFHPAAGWRAQAENRATPAARIGISDFGPGSVPAATATHDIGGMQVFKTCIRFLAPATVTAALLCASPAALAATASPATAFSTLMADVSAGNAAGAAALLSPTVTWTAGPAQAYPPNFPLSASGAVAVGGLLAKEQAAHITMQLAGTPQVSGDKVTFTANLSNPTLQALGVKSVQVNGTAVVTNGQVSAVTTTVAPASVAELVKAYGTKAAAAAPAATLPKTGAGALPWVGACLLLTGGLLLRRPRVRAVAR